MSSHQKLGECLTDFRDSCNSDQQLRRMLSDWDRIILVKATDIESQYSLVVKDGTVFLEEAASPDGADMTVIAGCELLVEIFSGLITPTEPYLSGSLRVMGTEEDVIRLDFISLMIWGE